MHFNTNTKILDGSGFQQNYSLKNSETNFPGSCNIATRIATARGDLLQIFGDGPYFDHQIHSIRTTFEHQFWHCKPLQTITKWAPNVVQTWTYDESEAKSIEQLDFEVQKNPHPPKSVTNYEKPMSESEKSEKQIRKKNVRRQKIESCKSSETRFAEVSWRSEPCSQGSWSPQRDSRSVNNFP